VGTRWDEVSAGLTEADIATTRGYAKRSWAEGARPTAHDNAPMESFFHTLKTELVHHRHYATRQEATRDIFAYAAH
jgi:transposase InsO family protein